MEYVGISRYFYAISKQILNNIRRLPFDSQCTWVYFLLSFWIGGWSVEHEMSLWNAQTLPSQISVISSPSPSYWLTKKAMVFLQGPLNYSSWNRNVQWVLHGNTIFWDQRRVSSASPFTAVWWSFEKLNENIRACCFRGDAAFYFIF